jgi:hypothetical protein
MYTCDQMLVGMCETWQVVQAGMQAIVPRCAMPSGELLGQRCKFSAQEEEGLHGVSSAHPTNGAIKGKHAT